MTGFSGSVRTGRFHKFFGKSNAWAVLAVVSGALALSGCASAPAKIAKKSKDHYSPRVVSLGAPVPKGGGHYKLGRPYKIGGKTYVPMEQPGYKKTGIASWYGDKFHGRLTANGEVYDMNRLTAAHPTLPLPSLVRVTNLANGKKVILRVNDRGPYAHDRIIDLSRRAAEILGTKQGGIQKVRVEYVSPAPMNGDDSFERQYARVR